MLPHRTAAKKFLANKSRTNFWDVVNEARIPEADKGILEDRFIRRHSIVKIAAEHKYSVEHVNDVIKNTYDSIYNLIMR